MGGPEGDPPPQVSTRRRRVRDAAGLLPLLATVLMLIPILWAAARTTSSALVYVFSAWALLIGLSAALSRSLSRTARVPGRAREGLHGERGT